VVLSGAATTAQLASNLAGTRLTLTAPQLDRLTSLAEPAQDYWRHRAGLAWS
jgi:hypothetical protein